MTLLDDDSLFLPGVPAGYIRSRLAKAGGHELTSGKLANAESSAALAVNTFGWFHDKPERLPAFPMLDGDLFPAIVVEVEYCARFPWSGGMHPWLDAWIETADTMIGIESKRFEPFRGSKRAAFSKAYDRPVWHDTMTPYEVMRDKLRSGTARFDFLDATQLVKHAFGLVTEGRRKEKRPYLVYLFAEPKECSSRTRFHREEIAAFAAAVRGAEVNFAAVSYREWLNTWPDADSELASHRAAILDRFQP